MQTLAQFALIGFLALGTIVSAAAQEAAPSWTLKDLDGREVSSSQFAGKVVVVDFWATWCGPCVEEIPGYVALQKKYGKDGLVIVGISLDRAGPARVKKFAEENGMNYVLVMGNDSVGEAFGGIEAIPTTFLISRDGKVVHRKMGAWPHERYEELVKKHL
jgi:thiol-disulfide isomerase/thioredoxin